MPVIDVDTGETVTVLMEDEPAPKRLKRMVAHNVEAPCDPLIVLCCDCLWYFTKVVKQLQSKVVEVKRERTDQEASLASVKSLDTMMSSSPDPRSPDTSITTEQHFNWRKVLLIFELRWKPMTMHNRHKQ